MIFEKEFYFIRHGQTDHNILEENQRGDDHEDIPINETGRKQALQIEPIISSLPIQTICSSPFKRAAQTREIITKNLPLIHHTIHDLSECSTEIWEEMARRGIDSPPQEGSIRQFMDRVGAGINQALLLPGPPLVVAHGGVHWALCCLMGIENHGWSIGNCVPVHFFVGPEGKWIGKKLG